MDDTRALLLDLFGRVHEAIPPVVDGLSAEQLCWAPGPDANPIAWLVWHLCRVEDDHLAGIAGSEQVWLSDGWADRFALPFDPADIGYGQTTEQVRQVPGDAELLVGYAAAVAARTREILSALTEDDLRRIVDERWDPPVTGSVRIVSVANDMT
ncbi:MAG: DUF664 domain-containing protein, partial [Candidatus Nanopelagicales bacterium]